MYLTKDSKRMLDAARNSEPTIQKRFYSSVTLAKSLGIYDYDTATSIAQHLAQQGAVEICPNDPSCFLLTEIGRNYHKYRRHETGQIILKSVLCPIAVTLLTEAAIHGLPRLLSLLQALAVGNP